MSWLLVQRIAALVGLVLLSPLLLILAVAIALDSGLPVLHRGRRVGRRGRPFRIVKLRTMRPGMPGLGLTVEDDPRLTRVGRRIRRFRLDELPQLWNVVRGEMALVGPRPEAPEFVDLAEPAWKEILGVHPGMTGPTQLRHLDEAALLGGDDPAGVYRRDLLPGKIASDLAYVRGRSVRGDVRLIAATLGTLAGRPRTPVP